MTPTDFFVLGLLVIITPPALAYYVDQRWMNGIDNNLPQLLRDISDAQRTGLSLPRAILESSKREYGPLTAELQKMARKFHGEFPLEKRCKLYQKPQIHL